ncbi:AcrB/AcrD/AcrF family protein [Epibacterium sp. SM1979]|uniref:AcrB/AcrD/AcrF family protein n=1 Tax=Tritonibacter litoralis TaxID=2662264 RepID=A0A843YFY6_9RHOB|nr:efflux RND transporter permease subunit [Tritonibacter litoralis]MQQ08738.1 AcrB/AcrD/AcrF family protein [Tritonibacter litoralis]
MARDLPERAQGILSYFTRHKTAANLLLVVLLVLGAAAIPNMRAQFFPDVILESVSVSVTWDDAGPEDVDAAIVQALEPALLAVEGVESTESTSREGSATIRMEFEPGRDMAQATDEVQSTVDAITTLPEEADEPTVRRGAWRDRVTDVVIEGPVDPEQLALFADELVVRLFDVGVTRTTIRGLAAPRTIVEVPSAQLIANDVTMAQIANAVAAEADANPAGEVESANARVRAGNARRSPEELMEVAIRVNPDGSVLRVGDVATVVVEGVARERAYFVGDHRAMSIRVDRSNQGDAIRVQKTVQETVDAFQETLPQGVTAQLIRTRAEAISGRLNILLDNGLMGLGLVVLLLFLFLNARIAFWVAAGIPAAMFAAVAVMYAAGLTINMVSLFGLIITLGIVVDDAIVVGEHADFRVRRLGESPKQAAENAARRMALPVIAAAITTIIAFFGLTNISGRFGELIRDIPLTVIAVLAASLVECFLILPNHMAHALAHANQGNWYEYPNRMVNKGFVWCRKNLFRPLMGLVVQARYVVLAGAVLLLATQMVLFINGDVRWRFFNAPERGSVTGNFAMVEGASRADSFEMMQEMQRATEALGKEYEERYGTNPLVFVMAEVGGNAGRGLGGVDSKDADLLGGISIELIDADQRPYSSFAFVGELQDKVQRHPMAEIVSFRGWRSGPGGDALDVQFYGSDLDVLKAAAEDLKTAVSVFGEVSAVEDTLAYDKEELVLELTPQGEALEFSIDALGRVLRARLGGIEAATYPDGPRNAEIRVELPEGELSADFLETMQLRTPGGAYVPLADIVSVTQRSGFSTVQRENGLRVLSVTGDISEDDPTRAAEIIEQLEQEILPQIASTRQVAWQLAGLSEQEDTFLTDARNALILVLTGIYLVLAWIFGSWTRPFVVMAIIPFGLVGTIWGHYIWEVPLSMFTVVGLLGMTGIIINDSIVLVSTIDEYAEARGLRPSIIDGAADRLRPVLLTTLTTVLGLAPLLYEGSQQAQFLKPTVITLVYGLGFGMVLVLLVVPALIAIQEDVQRIRTAMRRGFSTSRLRPLMVGVLAAQMALFAVTLGWVMVSGALWPPFAALPGAETAPMVLALGVFVTGAAGVSAIGYAVGSLTYAFKRIRA